jgi:hypothetical protein
MGLKTISPKELLGLVERRAVTFDRPVEEIVQPGEPCP